MKALHIRLSLITSQHNYRSVHNLASCLASHPLDNIRVMVIVCWVKREHQNCSVLNCVIQCSQSVSQQHTYLDDQLVSVSAWHCWFGHLACENRPRNVTLNINQPTNPAVFISCLLFCHHLLSVAFVINFWIITWAPTTSAALPSSCVVVDKQRNICRNMEIYFFVFTLAPRLPFGPGGPGIPGGPGLPVTSSSDGDVT